MAKYHFNAERHCHTLDGKELIGTTTALSVLAKPLTWWASGMAVAEMGWRNPKITTMDECEVAARTALNKIKSMSLEQYLTLLDTAYRAHNTRKEKAAESGIELHTLVERWIKRSIEIGSHDNFESYPAEIARFVAWARENVERFLFSEGHCYCEMLWIGGIADFGYEDNAGNLVLADLKSSKEPYYSMWVQLAGYQLQIEENGVFDAEGTLIWKPPSEFKYHAIFCAGAGLDKPFINKDVVRNRRAFGYCVQLYKEKMFFENSTGPARVKAYKAKKTAEAREALNGV